MRQGILVAVLMLISTAASAIEVREVVRAVGYDRHDCQYRLQNEISRKESTILQSCQSQAKAACTVISRRFMGSGYIYPVTGSYRVDEYKIDPNVCRDKAALRAEDDAIRNCESDYGVRCYVTRRGVSDHREERRRRYGLFGPKENFQVCRGQAEAAPEGPYREQCSVEIIAANR